ncbi:hypothetical protein GGF38_000024 [Coemansia sp. RSA 25]|nr:hypothetical protein GGF38_000024 [Coemansia sp. RSA 25]
MDIVDDIERCTHLVMPVLATTTKLIRALVFGCRVVAPEYIYSLEALPLSFKIQNPTLDLVDEFAGSLKFMPPAHAPVASPESPVDLSAVNWSPDNMRQCLFESKLFAFAEASQMNKYASLIKAAGGSGVLLKGAVDWAGSHSRSTESFQACCASLVDKVQALAREAKGTSATLPLKCLVLPPSPPPLPADRDVQSDFDVTALVSTVARLLGVRPISESEIGLAVLFVSSETHTNPVHGLLPSVPLRVTEAQTSSTTVETGEARQEDLVSTTALEPAGLPRRRRVPRISNFWNDKVATDASAILASDSMPSANLENARVSMEALSVASPTGPAAPVSEPAALEPEPELARPRRRVGVEGFWANAVSGSSQAARALDEGQQPTADSMDNVPSVPDVSAGVESGAQAASAPVRTITEYQQHHGAVAVERVSLVRRKQYPAACQAEHSSGAPNYKRFKKTVHPYQLV